MANMKIQLARLETTLKDDRGHNFTLLSKKTTNLKCLAFAENFDTKYAGFSRCENTAQRPRNRCFFSMERNWNSTTCRPFPLELCQWVRLFTAQRKSKFISRRSEFYFPDRVLSVFYDSILAHLCGVVRCFAISYQICHLRYFCQWFVRPWLDLKLQIDILPRERYGINFRRNFLR